MEERWAVEVRRVGAIQMGTGETESLPFRVSGVVSCIEDAASERTVSCTLTEDRTTLEALSSSMNQFYSASSNPPVALAQVREGALYVICVDSNWHRVCVEEVDVDARCCTVRLIDVGSTRKMLLSHIYYIDTNFINAPYKKCFAVNFRVPYAAPSASQFASVTSLKKGDEVKIFVLSDEEPFLALFATKGSPVLPEHLASGMDYYDATRWKSSFTFDDSKGLTRGYFPPATLAMPSFSNDVTVASFESLSNFYVRDPEQSVRLFFLDQLMEKIYGSEQSRRKFGFSNAHWVSEPTICAVYCRQLKKWLRARVICVNSSQSAVDVNCVDRPSISLFDVKLYGGDVLLLPRSLTFRPLCSGVRAEVSTDKLETSIRSLAARDVMRPGARIRIHYSPASTYVAVELNDSTTLDAYILQHLRECSAIGNLSMGLGSEDSMFSRSLCATPQMYSGGSPRFTSTPVRKYSRGFVPSLRSLDERAALQPFHRSFAHSVDFRGDSSFSSSRYGITSTPTRDPFSNQYFSESFRRQPRNVFDSISINERSSSEFAASQRMSHRPEDSGEQFATSRRSLVPPKDDDEFRVPTLPARRNTRPVRFDSFEHDFLNRTNGTSCDSEVDSDAFTRSVKIRRPQRRVSFSDTDSHSDGDKEAKENRDSLVAMRVVNVHSALAMFVETEETKRRGFELKRKLESIPPGSLTLVNGSWSREGNRFLYKNKEGRMQRISVAERSDRTDEIRLIDIDSGEEVFVNKNTAFYKLPRSLDPSRQHEGCIGPLRLAGKFDIRWLFVNATVRLRELCDNAVRGRIDIQEGRQCVTLFDRDNVSINELFIQFIASEVAEGRQDEIMDPPSFSDNA